MVKPADSIGAGVVHEEDVDTIELQLSAEEMRALLRAAAVAVGPDPTPLPEPEPPKQMEAREAPLELRPVKPVVPERPKVDVTAWVARPAPTPPVQSAPPPKRPLRMAHIVLAVTAFVGGLITSVAYVAMTHESAPPPLAEAAPPVVDELPPLPKAETPPIAEAPAPEPVLFRNPFDRSEVFEFPPGTTQAEARDAVAELLMQRARERRGTPRS